MFAVSTISPVHSAHSLLIRPVHSHGIMLRQKPAELFRLLVGSSAHLDRALFAPSVQQAFHGGGPSSGTDASPSEAGPKTDAFTEKLQEKGRKELESLTSKPQDEDDDWVDVWPVCKHVLPSGPYAKSVSESVCFHDAG